MSAPRSTFGSSAYGGPGWSPREQGLADELGTVWTRCGIDSEYRRQRDNPLRDGSDEAFLSSLAIAWEPQGGFGIALSADNLTDDDYQQFPGTPAVGRQVSLSARYQW